MRKETENSKKDRPLVIIEPKQAFFYAKDVVGNVVRKWSQL